MSWKIKSEYCVNSKLGIWLANLGGSFHPSLIFKNNKNDSTFPGISIFTEKEIHHQEILASCPLSAIINRKNCLEKIEKLLKFKFSNEEESENFKKNQELINNWIDQTVISLYLILTKISVKLKLKKTYENDSVDSNEINHIINNLFSFHEEYVRLLPEPDQMMTPLYWNQNEIEMLQSTLLYNTVIEQKERWKNDYKSLMKDILSISPHLYNFISFHISSDDYFWARTIITSRSFSSNLLIPSNDYKDETKYKVLNKNQDKNTPNPILLPGFDIFNHQRGKKVEWNSNIINSKVELIQLVNLSNQLAFEQVFNNYGAKSTGELIMGYGFALSEEDWNKNIDLVVVNKNKNNPDDFYTIKLMKPKTKRVNFELINEIFNKLKDEDLMHHIMRDGSIPINLLAQLKILVISTREEIDKLDYLCQISTDNALISLQSNKINWLNELNMLDCLISMLNQKLQHLIKFEQTIKETNQCNNFRNPVKKMIQIYRQGQIHVLQSALEYSTNQFEITLSEAKEEGFDYQSDSELELESDD